MKVYKNQDTTSSENNLLNFKLKNQLKKPSLIAVQGAPSSCSRRISFKATRSSVSLLRPLKTVAYVPYVNGSYV